MNYLPKYLTVVLVTLAIAVVFTACAKQPTEEMDAAKAAIDAVVAEGGEKYAADELKALNDEYTNAMNEIKAQEGKFLKNYDTAKQILDSTRQKAESLKADLPLRKEKAKTDAQTTLDAAKTAVADAKGILEKAPRGKGSMADIEALKSDIIGLEEAIIEADGLMDSEDYFAVIDKATGIKTKAEEISTQVTEALAKKAQATKK